MFVAELDRPWSETPFLLQGFLVEDQEQVAQLRSYCRFVFVDRSRSAAGVLPESGDPTPRPRAPLPHGPRTGTSSVQAKEHTPRPRPTIPPGSKKSITPAPAAASGGAGGMSDAEALILDVIEELGPRASIDTGPRVGPLTLEQILCDGAVEILTNAEDGQPLTLGPTTRTIPPKLRRFILHRDGGACTADGCQSRYRLQPHHIQPRSQGGSHHPDNLTTLCWYHHHVVIHRNGYRINPNSPPQRRRFLRPDGRHPPRTNAAPDSNRTLPTAHPPLPTHSTRPY